jgi:hypothetical protein
MEKSTSYTVVLDASVLVPGFLSNLLLWLADTKLFQAKWTEDIHTEWMRGRSKRFGHDMNTLQARRKILDEKFPHCLVTGYQSLINNLPLPDLEDRHVLAAAITCGADAIITSNLKHFPPAVLTSFNIVAAQPDDFILDQLDLSNQSARLVAIAIVRHKKSMSKSRPTWKQYLQAMARPGVRLQKTYTEISSPTYKILIADVIRKRDWLAEHDYILT